MLKNTLILFTASLPFFGYADELADCDENFCLLSPEPIESCQIPIGIFHPALYSVQSDCLNISLGAEFIYWEMVQDDLPQVADRFTFDGNLTDLARLAHEPGYKPGFSVILGMGFPQLDNWNLEAKYTWFHTTTTKHFGAQLNQFITPKLTPVLFFMASSSLNSELTMNWNFLQVTMGRAFYLSQRLIVRPAVGLKTTWCGHKHDLFFDVITGARGTQFTKTHIWGVGPFLGAEIQGLLWCGAYLTGNASVWPTYTRLNKYRVDSNFPPVPAFGFFGFVNEETNERGRYTTNLLYSAGIGLGWASYFCDCNYYIDFSIGYDMTTTFLRTMPPLEQGLAIRGFYYQGLSIKGQFVF